MTAIFSTHEAVSLEKKLDHEENHVVHVQDDAWDKIQLDRCVAWIKCNAYLKVCLQFPDGLLPASTGIAKQLEDATGSEIFILGDTSYGACCVDEVRIKQFSNSPFSFNRSYSMFQIAAEHAQTDAIIHFGHACLSKVTRSPVLYVLPKYKIVVQEFVNAFMEKMTDIESKISLFYDVGYYHAIGE
jgi:diphthamide biosynthesis protein 2